MNNAQRREDALTQKYNKNNTNFGILPCRYHSHTAICVTDGVVGRRISAFIYIDYLFRDQKRYWYIELIPAAVPVPRVTNTSHGLRINNK